MSRYPLRQALGFLSACPRPYPEGPRDGPRVDAALTAVVVPSKLAGLTRLDTTPAPSWDCGPARSSWPWCEAPPVGLSPVCNSDRRAERSEVPRRYGWRGLTAKGRRAIRSGVCAMEQRRRDCAFWTISLPGEALDRLADLDAWPVFQDHIRRFLRRLLLRHGLGGLAVACVELQPARSARERRPCPHLHVAFIGKRPGRRVWALHRSVLDAVIVRALAAAGVHGVDVSAAGNVQPVRRTVGGYLSKYLCKAGAELECRADRHLQLVPRQWWFQTRELRALAESFAAWIPSRMALALVAAFQLGGQTPGAVVGRVKVSDPRAPSCYRLTFLGADGLVEAMEWWGGNSPRWHTGG